ncbi:hypothetical protein BD410DRAFT_832359 [Rickenella mellea]|uniref:Uncharacterized protein n=1 Tax=Rickenella mellea TaxID=50990 RepID=A0A4Y7PN80_9AGAM|nr:hypothetical protein BD410DRAFT_832359 [Rickenella mellea]
MSRPRRLFLHVSALSDQEYAIYSSALHDLLDDADKDSQITDDAELENTVLGAREVRAWMKGRYRDVGSVDQILRMFAPSLGPTDTLTGGQVLAALRLVMHARSGDPVAEGLVFVQATPSSPTTTPSFSKQIQPSSRTSVSELPSADVDTPTPPAKSNPFKRDPTVRRASDGAVHRPSSPPPPIPTTPASTSNTNITPASNSNLKTNPFIQRSKSHVSPSTSLPSPSSTNTLTPSKIPPLPPRKPIALSGSQSANPVIPSFPAFPSSTSSPAAFTGTPSSPPKGASTAVAPPLHPLHPLHSGYPSLTRPHTQSTSHPSPSPSAPLTAGFSSLTTPLMRQSLHASKAGTSLKNAQTALEKARVVEVLRSSGNSSRNSSLSHNHHGSGNGGGHSVDYQNPNLGDRGRRDDSPFNSAAAHGRSRRPAPSPPRSATGSASSLEQVAGARLSVSSSGASSSSSPGGSRSPIHQSIDSPRTRSPPPTHPDRRGSAHAGVGQLQLQQQQREHMSKSPFDTPSSTPFDGPAQSPFTFPSSPGTGTGPTAPRPVRSQSLHHPPGFSPTSLTSVSATTSSSGGAGGNGNGTGAGAGGQGPPVPPRRRRPESVQVLPDSEFVASSSRSTPSLSRHLSLAARPSPSHSSSTASNFNAANKDAPAHAGELTLAMLHKSLTDLHARAQPAIDRARYKAEAGIAKRRGFVKHHGGGRREEGEEELVDRGGMDEGGDGGGFDEGGGGVVGGGGDGGGGFFGGGVVDDDDDDGVGVGGGGAWGSGASGGRAWACAGEVRVRGSALALDGVELPVGAGCLIGEFEETTSAFPPQRIVAGGFGTRGNELGGGVTGADLRLHITARRSAISLARLATSSSFMSLSRSSSGILMSSLASTAERVETQTNSGEGVGGDIQGSV